MVDTTKFVFTIDQELLKLAKERAASLNISTAAYMRLLITSDILRNGTRRDDGGVIL